MNMQSHHITPRTRNMQIDYELLSSKCRRECAEFGSVDSDACFCLSSNWPGRAGGSVQGLASAPNSVLGEDSDAEVHDESTSTGSLCP